jgi:hypothetical protein
MLLFGLGALIPLAETLAWQSLSKL